MGNEQDALDNISKGIQYLFDSENSNSFMKKSLVELFLEKIQILEKLEANDLCIEEYKNLVNILFTYLQNPELMIQNEKLFLNPIKNYI